MSGMKDYQRGYEKGYTTGPSHLPKNFTESVGYNAGQAQRQRETQARRQGAPGDAGDATAGLIRGLDLYQLEDNRRYFPPYDAVPVARSATLLRYPQVRQALEGLAGRITAEQMREMNYAADAQRDAPADIARRFLETLR